MLSATDSQRWASSPEDAWQVEEAVLTWAVGQHVTEPVVVALADGQTAFAFCLGGAANDD
jgi:hypothetical protein